MAKAFDGRTINFNPDGLVTWGQLKRVSGVINLNKNQGGYVTYIGQTGNRHTLYVKGTIGNQDPKYYVDNKQVESWQRVKELVYKQGLFEPTIGEPPGFVAIDLDSANAIFRYDSDNT